jgi:hypothetical protein
MSITWITLSNELWGINIDSFLGKDGARHDKLHIARRKKHAG